MGKEIFMKKNLMRLLLAMFGVFMLTGCGQKEEKPQPQQTETYVEENTVTTVHHDIENVDFRIAVISGEMETGLTNLMEDAENGEAGNRYRFYEYDDFSKFRSLFDCGTVDVATLSLRQALEIYRQNPDFICILAINSEGEDGYGVTVANRAFVSAYPSAMKLFEEEMKYSAKEAVCITGAEMRSLIEEQLIAWEEELPGDEFYYPLPELPAEEATDVNSQEQPEEMKEND